MLVTLTDQELADDLGMKPLQIKKLRKRMGAGAAEKDDTSSDEVDGNGWEFIYVTASVWDWFAVAQLTCPLAWLLPLRLMSC